MASLTRGLFIHIDGDCDAPTQTFRAKAPAIVTMLLADFPLDPSDGFEVVGYAGHESKGLTTLQKIRPSRTSRVARGSFQWTGRAAGAFDAYCKRNELDQTSDRANSG
ncbi:hypothetical protein ABIB57_005361 [Devosia sp. UYZn731]